MILPFLYGLISPLRAPVTWLLVLMNFGMIVVHQFSTETSTQSWEKALKKESFILTQGRVYRQFLRETQQERTVLLQAFSQELDHLEDQHIEALGYLALRDHQFRKDALTLPFSGDQIEIQNWREEYKKLLDLQGVHQSYILGVSGHEFEPLQWLTYIFAHSGLTHFLVNMLFLVLFGGALEIAVGGLSVLVVFLFSGVFGAGAYLLLVGPSVAPLIGASGAVSGLTAFFAMTYGARPVAFIYLLLPKRGYSGFVYLPAWVAVVTWVVSDLAGFFANLPELGGVAYSAHLGGALCGITAGSILFLKRKIWPSKNAGLITQSPKAGTMIPFTPFDSNPSSTLKKIA